MSQSTNRRRECSSACRPVSLLAQVRRAIARGKLFSATVVRVALPIVAGCGIAQAQTVPADATSSLAEFRRRYQACATGRSADNPACYGAVAVALDTARRRMPHDDQSEAFFLLADARLRAGEFTAAERMLIGAERAMVSQGYARSRRGRQELAAINYRLAPALSAQGRWREAAARYVRHIARAWVFDHGACLLMLVLWVGIWTVAVPSPQGNGTLRRLRLAAIVLVPAALQPALGLYAPLASLIANGDPFAYLLSTTARWRSEPIVIAAWIITLSVLILLARRIGRAALIGPDGRDVALGSEVASARGLRLAPRITIALLGLMVVLISDSGFRTSIGQAQGWQGLPYVTQLIGLALVAGILSEVLFRGVLMSLATGLYGPSFALVATSLAYAGALGDPDQFPAMLVAGLAYGSLSMLTGSVRTSASVHVAANLVLQCFAGPSARIWL